jgi:catecholate siderophore receptor
VVAPIVKIVPIEETQNDAQTISAYGFDSITVLPLLILSLGVRFDRFKRPCEPGQAQRDQHFALSRDRRPVQLAGGAVFKPTRTLRSTHPTRPRDAAQHADRRRARRQCARHRPTRRRLAQLQSARRSSRPARTRSASKGQLFDNQLATGIALFPTRTEQRAASPARTNTSSSSASGRIRGVELTFNGNVHHWLDRVRRLHLPRTPRIVDAASPRCTAPAVTGQAARTVLVRRSTPAARRPRPPSTASRCGPSSTRPAASASAAAPSTPAACSAGIRDNRAARRIPPAW